MILSKLARANTRSVEQRFRWSSLLNPSGWNGIANTEQMDVGDDEALGLSAWFNGVSIIAGTVASLPLKLYRKDGRRRTELRSDPRFQLMHRSPHPWLTSFEFREALTGHALTRGNGFARVLRDTSGRPNQLVPLYPDRIRRVTHGADGLTYYVSSTDGPETPVPGSEMLHLKGIGGDGLLGVSVVDIARKSLGYSLALERQGSALMANKARPGGLLSTDQVLTKEQRDALAQAWEREYGAGKLGRTAVLDAGLTWQSIGFTAEDAQFIGSREFQVQEVARWLNLPPHFLKDLSRATHSNIEEQSIEFVRHTVLPWVARWEQRLDRTLLTPEEQRAGYYFRHDLRGLLRGDSESRAAFYRALHGMGALSPNEIRRLEDAEPVPGGDRHYVHVNMAPVSDEVPAL